MNWEEQMRRLADAGIQCLPAEEITSHFVLERDGFIALVERTEQGFGQIGNPGLLLDGGFAVLVWRGKQPVFVSREKETPAEPAQVEALRSFARDLKATLADR